jgi:putative glutamine amidotransferase
MSKNLPIVGIACDVIKNGLHQFHGAGEKYINAVAHGAGAMPVLLPAFGEGTDMRDLNALYNVQDIVSGLDGLFLTGSPSTILMDLNTRRVRWKILSEIVLHSR